MQFVLTLLNRKIKYYRKHILKLIQQFFFQRKYVFTQPLCNRQSVTQGQFLNSVQLVRIQSVSSLKLVALQRKKNPVSSTIYPQPRREERDLCVSQGH